MEASKCKLGNGRGIAFWHDLWLDCGRLATFCPVLFTFSMSPFCIATSQIRDGEWNLHLHPNLSSMATQELAILTEILSNVHPQHDTPDTRMPILDDKSLSTAYFYKLLTFRGSNHTTACYIWDRVIPHKHHIILWIALRDRHNTRDNMLRKHWDKVVSNNGCDLCQAAETMNHILLMQASARPMVQVGTA